MTDRTATASDPSRTIGRYLLFDEIGHGGMATVHLGRMTGAAGFSRPVAIKRMHPHCARDPKFATAFLDEARLAGRIQHPNVAAMLDVVNTDGELLLVMEYVHGEPLSRLIREPVPPAVAVGIACGVLHGLEAAHDATNERGEPLHVIHRDVSPQNVLVGADGVTRLVDFGVAKAAHRLQTTVDGEIKGKLAYMPPEQLEDRDVDRRVDVYATAVVLWEMLAGRRLFSAKTPGGIVTRVLEMEVEPPTHFGGDALRALDDVVLRGLARDPNERYATADDMAAALETAHAPATSREIAGWVRNVAGERLDKRVELVASVSGRAPPPSAEPAPATATPAPPDLGAMMSTVITTPDAARRASSAPRRGWLVAGFVIAAAALGGSGWALARRASEAPVALVPETSVSPPASPAPWRAPTSSAPVAASSALVAASASPSAASPARPPQATTRARLPKPPVTATTRPTRCDPPYVLDPADPRIHIPKPDCL